MMGPKLEILKRLFVYKGEDFGLKTLVRVTYILFMFIVSFYFLFTVTGEGLGFRIFGMLSIVTIGLYWAPIFQNKVLENDFSLKSFVLFLIPGLNLFAMMLLLASGAVKRMSKFGYPLSEEDKEKIRNYISEYLSGKDLMYISAISNFCETNKDEVNFSIEEERELQRALLRDLKSKSKSNLSGDRIQEFAKAIRIRENILDFLDDLEKFHKLFEKKGIETNYREILSLFEEVTKERVNKEFDKFLEPAYEKISKNLEGEVNKRKVIKEFIKLPSDLECHVPGISRLLDKFGLEYQEEELKNLIEEAKEEVELERFENNLGSPRRDVICDFKSLNGYEFEDYIRNLFKELGYPVVKTNLSGDQGADHIISKGGEKVVVQAKKYSNKVTNKAVQEAVAAKKYYDADKAMVVTDSSFTDSAVELALANNVMLWDGEKLRSVVKSLNSKKESKDLSGGDLSNSIPDFASFRKKIRKKQRQAKTTEEHIKVMDFLVEEGIQKIHEAIQCGRNWAAMGSVSRSEILDLSKDLESVLNTSILGSLNATILNALRLSFKAPVNEQKFSKSEQERFDEFYKNIGERLEGEERSITEEEYENIKEEIRRLENKEEIPGFYSLLERIENLVNYDKKIKKVKDCRKKINEFKSEMGESTKERMEKESGYYTEKIDEKTKNGLKKDLKLNQKNKERFSELLKIERRIRETLNSRDLSENDFRVVGNILIKHIRTRLALYSVFYNNPFSEEYIKMERGKFKTNTEMNYKEDLTYALKKIENEDLREKVKGLMKKAKSLLIQAEKDYVEEVEKRMGIKPYEDSLNGR